MPNELTREGGRGRMNVGGKEGIKVGEGSDVGINGRRK